MLECRMQLKPLFQLLAGMNAGKEPKRMLELRIILMALVCLFGIGHETRRYEVQELAYCYRVLECAILSSEYLGECEPFFISEKMRVITDILGFNPDGRIDSSATTSNNPLEIDWLPQLLRIQQSPWSSPAAHRCRTTYRYCPA